MTESITEKEKNLMRHALGIPAHDYKKGVSHRNYFAAEPGSADFSTWEGLVVKGHAIRHGSNPIFGDLVYFSVADHMKKPLGVKKEI